MITQRLLCLTFSLLLKVSCLIAQFPSISEPAITQPQFSIYISAIGNDENDGSITLPVQNFQRAMELIPFQDNDDVSGEIVFLEGDYYPNQALVQKYINHQNGSYKRNLSIQGVGEVNIFGDNTPEGSHLLVLRGSGISIKNINLFNSKGIGILISNPSQDGKLTHESQVNNVLIEDVLVDNTISHGVISQLVSKIKFDKVTVKNACQENTDINGNCQWGSALRTGFCDNIIVRNCKIYQNRGEGINIGTSTLALVETNISYDNFSANIYCIRSNKAIFRNNLIYNRDSIYWRNCQPDDGGVPQIRKPSAGFSIANEVSYDDFFSNNCGPERSFLDGIFHNKIADSIFFYNNILVLAPLHITDESRGNCLFPAFSHANNLSHIFIENNTFIGDISANHDYLNRHPIISMSFDPSYFWGCLFNVNGVGNYRAENIVFRNNIVSLKDTWNGEVINSGFVLYGGRPCNGGVLGDKFFSSGNTWHHAPAQIYDHFASNYISNFLHSVNDSTDDEILTTFDPRESLSALVPDQIFNHFYKKATYSSYINKDFLGNNRDLNNSQLSNVGALEAKQFVFVNESVSANSAHTLFPNPSKGDLHIISKNFINVESHIDVINSNGIHLKVQISELDNNHEILDLHSFAQGMYYIKITEDENTYLYKVVKLD